METNLVKNEIERYVSKELQAYSSTALPLHPDILFEHTRLTKKIEELRTKITELEARLEKLIDTEQNLIYLQTFKDQFNLHCVREGYEVSILRCSNIISMGFCNFKKTCKGRLALGRKLQYITYL